MNVNKMQPSLRGSQSSLQSRSTSDGTNQMVRDRPASAYLPNNYHPQLPPQGGVVGAPMQGSPLRYPQGGPYTDNGPLGGYPPNHNSTASGRLSQQPPDYADSPPPPPPPPSTTHPLYQTQRGPEPARYAASGGEPPRGSYFPSPGNQQDKQQYLYQGSNPWQREEKEREAERRRNAARHWRDQQINELLSLPNRNPQQEEHLRALKLEREFERRAEELEEEEEEDQEAAERVQGLLRVAQQKDERRSVRGPAPQLSSNQNSPNQQQPYSPHTTPTSQTNGPIARTPLSSNQMPSSYSSSSAEEKARLQRLKELRMKQAEVEAERMKKKQEEELRSQGIEPVSSTHMTSRTAAMNSSSTMSRTLTSTSNLRLDNLVINTPANVTPNSHYHNNNGYSSSQASPAGQDLKMFSKLGHVLF
ncbi:unnamed protein product [Nesidiocoris tenuis]|uniref:Uncharacterized protein n=1 Tax=Nesidiocoris tenuis TaxID=355587 RepID=A0A6H5FWV9_9HEMI|nr:unnamed protein product [Nesidiocoris tenuis]